MEKFIRKILPFLLTISATILNFVFKQKNDEETHYKALEKWMKDHPEELRD